MCNVVGCDQKGIYYDEMDNKLCEDCKMQEMREQYTSEEDYELIKVSNKATALAALEGKKEIKCKLNFRGQ